jgi:hypothetical protein
MFLSDLSGGENNWKKKSLCCALEGSLMSARSGYTKILSLSLLNFGALPEIKRRVFL